MDVDTFIQIINGVGFPIAVCIGLGWFIITERKNNRLGLEKQATQFNAMILKLTESVDNNTSMIESLTDQIREEGHNGYKKGMDY